MDGTNWVILWTPYVFRADFILRYKKNNVLERVNLPFNALRNVSDPSHYINC